MRVLQPDQPRQVVRHRAVKVVREPRVHRNAVLVLAVLARPGTCDLNSEEVDSVFRLLALPGGLIAAPSFNTDRIHFIDARSKTLNPPPFFGPIAVGPGRPIFEGLQVIARRPGRAGVDFVGPDLFAVAGIASRIIPVELRKLLGP